MTDNVPHTAQTINHQQQILAVCQPLLEAFNISYFAHARVFSDNSVAIIIDNEALEKEWFHLKCPSRLYLGNNLYLYVWTGCPSKKPNQPKLSAIRFYLMHKGIDYTDVYVLSPQLKMTKVIADYLKTVETIQAFVEQYQQRTQTLIQAIIPTTQSQKANLVLPKPEALIPTIEMLLASPRTLLTLYVGQASKPIKVTFNERLCLVGIIQGLTLQELSNLMGLSHRTIEKYISQLKQKFKCKKLAQLTYFLGKANVDLADVIKTC